MGKAQAALEYMLLLGVLLAFLVPILVYSAQASSLSVRSLQGREAVQSIAEAADRVYAMGGGKVYTFVTIPSGVVNQSVSGRTLRLVLETGGSASEAVGTTLGNISGSLPTNYGKHKITLEMLQNGTINISA